MAKSGFVPIVLLVLGIFVGKNLNLPSPTPVVRTKIDEPDDIDSAYLVQHYSGYTFEELTPLIRSWTMVSHQHLQFAWKAVEQVNARGIEGDVVECGVWKGGNSMMMVFANMRHNTNRHFWLFDTFEGLPPPTDEKNGARAKNIYTQIDQGIKSGAVLSREKTRSIESGKWNFGPKDIVKNNLRYTGYPKDKVHFVQGKVEETLSVPSNVPEKIAVLRLDTDWYESTKAELDIMYDRLQSGGVLILDDFCSWQGSKTATVEFFKNKLNLDAEAIMKQGKAKGEPCFVYWKP